MLDSHFHWYNVLHNSNAQAIYWSTIGIFDFKHWQIIYVFIACISMCVIDALIYYIFTELCKSTWAGQCLIHYFVYC